MSPRDRPEATHGPSALDVGGPALGDLVRVRVRVKIRVRVVRVRVRVRVRIRVGLLGFGFGFERLCAWRPPLP